MWGSFSSGGFLQEGPHASAVEGGAVAGEGFSPGGGDAPKPRRRVVAGDANGPTRKKDKKEARQCGIRPHIREKT